jgi:hypothetical protein
MAGPPVGGPFSTKKGNTMVIERSYEFLHPTVRVQFINLGQRLQLAYERGETDKRFMVFETYRSPMRQAELMAKGRVTKAPPWSSAHQFGLAADFAGVDVDGKWTWALSNDELDFLKERAEEYGLMVPMAWDPCHVQSPLWSKVFKAMHPTPKE